LNVVSIFAHQDDEMRCLGTMLKCKTRGDSLTFVTLTDGSIGIEDVKCAESAKIRLKEMSNLADSIKADYISLNEKDSFLYDSKDVRIRLIEVIRKTGADLIFTHYFSDYNNDHITVFELVRQCCMHASLPYIKTISQPLKEHPAVFMVEPHGVINFPATHFVDVSEYEEQKIELLKNHISQEKAMRDAVKAGFEKLVKIPDSYWGQKVCCQYAECFIALPSRGSVKAYNVLP
jgi:N-acetylglucosamine malate deacetylase 1